MAMNTEIRRILLLGAAEMPQRKMFHRVISVPLKSAFSPLGVTSIPALVAHFQHTKKCLLKSTLPLAHPHLPGNFLPAGAEDSGCR